MLFIYFNPPYELILIAFQKIIQELYIYIYLYATLMTLINSLIVIKDLLKKHY